MHRGVHGTTGTSSRRQRHGHGKAVLRDAGLDVSRFLPDASPDNQPESAGSLRRHIAQTLMKHHQLVERNNQALQPLSPASYDSSLEVARYNPVVTPSSSLEYRGRRGEARYSLKTSTELLKVLNRIWSLEEQHSANISLIKALKTELSHARVRIKELLRDQQTDRHELDDLMKQFAEEKLSRKSKEHDRISCAVQSVREELEDERKLRKRSEGLHRKLAREVSEVKSTLSNCTKDLEKETKSRKLLENLCDEFARGIKSYEREIRTLRQKMDKDWTGREERDQMVLHVAESWLDERMQMKLNSETNRDCSVLEKLEFEIETFLQDKPKINSIENPNLLQKNRRNSLESVPLNDATSAPRDCCDEQDSSESDSNCFELKKTADVDVAKSPKDEEDEKPNQLNRDVAVIEKPKGQKGQSPSGLQVKFEEQMAWAMSCNGKKKVRAVDIAGKEGEEEEERTELETENGKNNGNETNQRSTNGVIGEMIKKHHRMLSENRENDEASCSYSSRRQASPIRQWTTRTITSDLDLDGSEPLKKTTTTTTTTKGLKDNTLKAKLAEVRSKNSRPRLKLFKGIK